MYRDLEKRTKIYKMAFFGVSGLFIATMCAYMIIIGFSYSALLGYLAVGYTAIIVIAIIGMLYIWRFVEYEHIDN